MRLMLCLGATEPEIFRPNWVNDSYWPASRGLVVTVKEEKRLGCRLGHCFLSKSCKIEISRMVLLSG